MKLKIRIDDRAMQEHLRRRIQEMPDKSKIVLQRLGVRMLRSVALNFTRSGRQDTTGGLWAPLSPVTVKMRKKGQRKSPKRLMATGRLRNSITFDVRGSELAVGTNVEYAKYHQQNGIFGESIPIRVFGKGHAQLPASPFLLFQKQDMKWVKRQITREFGRGG